MNLEYLVIGLIFIVALFYLLNKVILPFSRKNGDGCSSGGCGCAPDLEEIEKKRK